MHSMNIITVVISVQRRDDENSCSDITLMQQMLLREALDEYKLREEMLLVSLDQLSYYTCPIDISHP